MQFDAKELFSDGQSLSGASGTRSTNTVNKGAAVNLGAGERRPKIVGHISNRGGTNPTLAVKLVGADNEGMSTNKITIAELAAKDYADGETFEIAIPKHTPKQFFELEYTQAGTSPEHDVVAGIVADIQTAD